MTTTQYGFPGVPTLLDMTNRVLRECGSYTVSTLNPGSVHSQVALDALSDGLWHIYARNRWMWAKKTQWINFASNQTDYMLNGDFDRLAIDPQLNGYVLNEYTPDEWSKRVQTVTPTQTGGPVAYKIETNTISFFPTPIDATVAAFPQIAVTYYANPGSRFDITDGGISPPIPVDFVECLVSYAKWKLKLFLEYPDAEADHARFEQLLQTQMNRNFHGRKPNQVRSQFEPISTSWGWI